MSHDYTQKYLKYKNKYLKLKNNFLAKQTGGNNNIDTELMQLGDTPTQTEVYGRKLKNSYLNNDNLNISGGGNKIENELSSLQNNSSSELKSSSSSDVSLSESSSSESSSSESSSNIKSQVQSSNMTSEINSSLSSLNN